MSLMNSAEMPKLESSTYAYIPQTVGKSNFNPTHLTTGSTFLETDPWQGMVERSIIAKTLDNKEETMSDRRIVNIYVVDPDKNITLEDAVLYTKEDLVTEDTDMDIMYDLDIKGMLETHNKIRLVTVDEDASLKRDKDILLKAIKASDLSIKIITMVKF